MAEKNDLLSEFDQTLGGESALGDGAELLKAFDEGAEVAPTPVERVARDPNSVSATLARSVDQLQANLGSTVEAVGEAAGSEYVAQVGKDYRQEQLQEASQYGAPEFTSYKDVDWEAPEQIGEYLKQMGLGAVPSLGVVGAGAGAGALVGSVVPVIGTGVGAGIGALLAGMGVNIGDVQSQIKEIDPDAKSPWTSILAGTGMGVLDAVGLKAVTRPLMKEFGEEATFQVLKSVGVIPSTAAQAVKGAAAEAGTEAAQSVAGNVAAAQATNTNIQVDKLIENAINSAVGGGIGGGVAGGAANVPAVISRNARVAGTARPGTKFTEGSKEPTSLAKHVWDTMGGTPLEMLKPLARVSPRAYDFIRAFRPDESGETATGATLAEQQALDAGSWAASLDEAMDVYGANVPVPKLRSRRREEFFKDLADPTRVKTPERAVAIQQARTAMDSVVQRAKDIGLDVGTIQNYLPLNLDAKRIEKNRSEFLATISPFFASDTDANNAIDQYLAQDKRGPNESPKIDRLVQPDGAGGWAVQPSARVKGDPETMRYKFGQGTTPPEFGHLEKSRAFGNVPQSKLMGWAKEKSGTAKYESVRDYFEGAAHRIAFAERFGAKGEKANAQIAMAVREGQEAGYPVTSAEVDRMYNMLDAYNGLYNNWKSPTAKTIQSTVGAIMTIKALPLATLSSLVEIATPAIRGDIAAALAALAPTFKEIAREGSRTLLQGSHKSEFAQLAAEANLTFAAAQNVASERLGANMFTRGAAKWTRRFFLINGLSYWTQMLTTYAAKTGDIIIQRNLNALANGLDITSAKGAQYANQLRSMGINIQTNADAETMWSPQTPSQIAAAREARRLGIRRFTRQAVLEPGLADTPLWMHSGQMQLLAMLHRYPAAFTNTILPALFRKGFPSWQGSRTLAGVGAASALFLLGLMVATGFLQDELKMIAKTGEYNYDDTRTESQVFADVLNTTISPVQTSYVANFFAAPRHGQSGVGANFPIVGAIDEAGKTIVNFAKDPEEGKIWQYLYKQTPAQFFRPGREAAKEFELTD